MNAVYKSPLHEMALSTPTDFWNDSCSIHELTYAIEHGAVGATSNPTIVLAVIKSEMNLWRARIREVITENPTWSEDEITWQIFGEVGQKGASLLLPVFERENGRKGRLSIQTNPAFYRNSAAIVEQAMRFAQLGANMQVKIPVTQAGIKAIEEATYRGVNINATVCFSVPQALAVAEAVECGLQRRASEGKEVQSMTPVCTIMVGRMDDWIQVLAHRDSVIAHPNSLVWPGVACMKKAYQIYRQRGYRTRLLAAAYRHHLHWSEFIGGEVSMTIPFEWQLRFNASDVKVIDRMDNPVPEQFLEELYTKFPDFRKAYDEDGMTVEEFDTYGATVRTLRGFISSYHELVALIRDFMLPNPDIES